jgi:hypothetical protein
VLNCLAIGRARKSACRARNFERVGSAGTWDDLTKDETCPPSSKPLMNRLRSATDRRDSRIMVALRFSIAFMISLSLFAEVEQTALHAVTIFGALITTAVFAVFFAVVVLT